VTTLDDRNLAAALGVMAAEHTLDPSHRVRGRLVGNEMARELRCQVAVSRRVVGEERERLHASLLAEHRARWRDHVREVNSELLDRALHVGRRRRGEARGGLALIDTSG